MTTAGEVDALIDELTVDACDPVLPLVWFRDPGDNTLMVAEQKD